MTRVEVRVHVYHSDEADHEIPVSHNKILPTDRRLTLVVIYLFNGDNDPYNMLVDFQYCLNGIQHYGR